MDGSRKAPAPQQSSRVGADVKTCGKNQGVTVLEHDEFWHHKIASERQKSSGGRMKGRKKKTINSRRVGGVALAHAFIKCWIPGGVGTRVA